MASAPKRSTQHGQHLVSLTAENQLLSMVFKNLTPPKASRSTQTNHQHTSAQLEFKNSNTTPQHSERARRTHGHDRIPPGFLHRVHPDPSIDRPELASAAPIPPRASRPGLSPSSQTQGLNGPIFEDPDNSYAGLSKSRIKLTNKNKYKNPMAPRSGPVPIYAANSSDANEVTNRHTFRDIGYDGTRHTYTHHGRLPRGR